MSVLNVTESAQNHIVSTLTAMNKDILLFGVKGGGCAGFEYFWMPLTVQEYSDITKDAKAKDESIDLPDGKTLAIDYASILYVLGSTIDYHQDFISSSLTVENPLAKSSCGCGTSVSFS